MVIGVPKEIKNWENRVAITQAGIATLKERGHLIVIETKAGEGSGIPDEVFRAAGAVIVPTAEDVYGRADLVLKVKEPLETEYPLLRPGQIVFTYLHLASSRELTDALLESGIVAVGYETVQLPNGILPLLIPMSEVAGRLAVQIGCYYLQAAFGGRGILLSGVPGVAPADVVIIGCGIVGMNAARMAMGLGAQLTLIDRDPERLRYAEDVLHGNVITLVSNPYTIENSVTFADLVVGAVLVPGATAPRLVTRGTVEKMKPGSVIVDVAIDQGGCIETMRPTTHSAPVFALNEVIHYGVTNMPAAVPRTSTWGLTNSTLPYVIEIADQGWVEAARQDSALMKGIQIVNGKLTHAAVAESFGMSYEEPAVAIEGMS